MTIGRGVRLASASASMLASVLLVGAGSVAQSPATSPAASFTATPAPGVACPSPASSLAPMSPAPGAEPAASPAASVAPAGSPSASPLTPIEACPPAGPSTAASVSIRDFAFDPPAITVAAGSTVTWTNAGPSVHTVTADDGSFDSMSIAPGATFEMTFETPGTYAYHCTPHPSMTATVVVE